MQFLGPTLEPQRFHTEIKLAVALAFASLIIVYVFFGTIQSTIHAIETEREIDNSYEVLLQLHDCLGWLTAAELSVRNYVASGNGDSLPLFTTASNNAEEHLQALKRLHQDRITIDSVEKLEPKIQEMLLRLRKAVALAGAGQSESAKVEIRSSKGLLLVSDSYGVAHEETKRELDTLHRLIKQSDLASKTTSFFLVVSGVIYFVVFSLLAFRLYQYLDQRLKAQFELEKLNLELEQRVRDRTAELQQANKELEAFSYSASHDLQAPLRIVNGFSKALLEDYETKLDPGAQRYLHTITKYTSSMGRLIDDLLAFSLAGKQEIHRSQVNMNKLVATVLEELSPSIGERKVKFSIEELPDLLGDEALMHQVLWNILSNALKFTRERQSAEIAFGCRSENGESIYHVKDNGVGFDMRYVDDLFSPFRRLHTAEEFEGTGIGLALVERIIHRHGGRVWAKGEIDKGATIYFAIQEMRNLKDA